RHELHPPAVLVAGGVLARKFHPKRLRRRAFGRRDVGLELDRIRARARDLVDERVGVAEAAVVRQTDFPDDETATVLEGVRHRLRKTHVTHVSSDRRGSIRRSAVFTRTMRSRRRFSPPPPPL